MTKQEHITADRETDEDDVEESSARAVSSRASAPARKKDRKMTAGAHWLFQFGLYKRSQGRVIRQLTFAALAVAVAAGAWRLSDFLHQPSVKYSVPLAIVAVGVWICYRLVNLPRFADFLIAVEAEMTKVSWPTRHELFKSSLVVILTIVGFAILLWFYDTFWNWLLRLLGV
jgi:preprotein translocase subunit SecE